MLNATECCKTIGCNCAGTQAVEGIGWLITHPLISTAAFMYLFMAFVITLQCSYTCHMTYGEYHLSFLSIMAGIFWPITFIYMAGRSIFE